MEEDEQRLRVRLVGSDGIVDMIPFRSTALLRLALNQACRYRGLRLNTG